ncbi:carboxypeptidase G2 [Legionella beliardensis]|uniref:Carboxypeptidase G2 n=1 Tax=Legionella beliardensis TaxID=91822 RepID=A0A378I243_9GAMM|nr:M20/M25/M40 family metallo-hydrolase [Legionella beliardensis]STX29022.1 carboxypeptidase G2 [Legionella beliardensis]
MKKNIGFLLSLLFVTQVYGLNTASSKEAQISHYLASKSQEQLNLLEKLVNINSGTTTNLPGVKQVGDILKAELEQLGFKTYWVAMPPNMNRAGTLIAYHQGNTGKKVLLIGHLDTVFPKQSAFKSFKRMGNKATGPGVIDAKGGDVVIIYALKALANINALSDATITVVFTGDEEDSGKPSTISRRPLIEAADHHDVALDFEWAISPNTATIARRGIADWQIDAQGNEAHSSQIFKEKIGSGAVFELVRILNTMRTELAGELYLTFNPGLIVGGTTVNHIDKAEPSVSGKENIIAKTAIAKGDLRFLTEAQKDAAKKKIISIVEQHLPDTKAKIIFNEGIPSMPPRKANLKLLQLYSDISIHLGYGKIEPVDPALRGAGDISYIAANVPYALAGLGPVGSGAHSTQETLDIPSLLMQTERATFLIYQLVNGYALAER